MCRSSFISEVRAANMTYGYFNEAERTARLVNDGRTVNVMKKFFGLFTQSLHFLQRYLWKMSILYLVPGFEPTASWSESPHVTTRQGLPPFINKFLHRIEIMRSQMLNEVYDYFKPNKFFIWAQCDVLLKNLFMTLTPGVYCKKGY